MMLRSRQIFTAFVVMALAGCTGRNTSANTANNNITLPADVHLPPSSLFNESWEWDTNTYSFTLEMKLKGDSIYGSYCFASQNRLDCGEGKPDDTSCKVKGFAKGNEAHIWFTSAYDEDDKWDTAFIIADAQNKTLTLIKQTSHIHSYFPDSLTMRRN